MPRRRGYRRGLRSGRAGSCRISAPWGTGVGGRGRSPMPRHGLASRPEPGRSHCWAGGLRCGLVPSELAGGCDVRRVSQDTRPLRWRWSNEPSRSVAGAAVRNRWPRRSWQASWCRSSRTWPIVLRRWAVSTLVGHSSSRIHGQSLSVHGHRLLRPRTLGIRRLQLGAPEPAIGQFRREPAVAVEHPQG
jgi:hypothetical protein